MVGGQSWGQAPVAGFSPPLSVSFSCPEPLPQHMFMYTWEGVLLMGPSMCQA